MGHPFPTGVGHWLWTDRGGLAQIMQVEPGSANFPNTLTMHGISNLHDFLNYSKDKFVENHGGKWQRLPDYL